jgi:hypothetical protein
MTSPFVGADGATGIAFAAENPARAVTKAAAAKNVFISVPLNQCHVGMATLLYTRGKNMEVQ